MKKIGFFLVITMCINTFAGAKTIADKVDANKKCVCNGLAANLPIVGLFHTSKWGTSALKVFSADDPTALDKCFQLLNQLKEIEVCR